MFSAQSIAIAFVTVFLAIGIFSFAEKRGWRSIAKLGVSVGLVASVYCIAAGLFLLSGWHDPLAGASSSDVSHAAASHGGRGGIVILAIRFWPYVLIGVGGYFVYGYVVILKRLLRSRA